MNEKYLEALLSDDIKEVEAPWELPLHPLQNAPEPDNAGVASQVLHPVAYPAPIAAYGTDAIDELEDFARYVGAMTEKDYGDWMRRVNLYFAHLRTDLISITHEKDNYVNEQLARIQRCIQYTPTFEIAETRRQVLEIAMELRKYFGGHGEVDLHNLQVSTIDSVKKVPEALKPFNQTLEDYDPEIFVPNTVNGIFTPDLTN